MAGASRLTRRRPKGWATLNSSTSPALWLNPSDKNTLQMDGAAEFTTASQSLYISDNTSFVVPANAGIWLAGWFKINSDADGTIISKYRSGSNGTFNLVYISALKRLEFGWYGDDGGHYRITVNNIITSANGTTWYHFFAYMSTTTSKVYVNNVDQSGPTSGVGNGTVLTTTRTFRLGSMDNSTSYFPGVLDSIAFGIPPTGTWLDTNGAAFCSYLYNSGFGRRSSDFKASSYYTGGNPSGAVSWWDLDEVPLSANTATTRNDRIGTNHLTDAGYVGYASGVASGAVQFDGDPVATCQDRSGNSRHATTNSAATRPTVKTNVVGVKAGIQLDGVDDLLATSSYSKGPSYTIIAVVRNTDATTGDRVISSAPGIHTLRYGNTRSFQNFSFNNASFPSTQASFPITATNTNIVSLVVSTEATLYTNGQKAVSIPTNGTGNSASVATTIGSVNSGSYLKGTLLEYIEYGSALTDAQRTTLERTLAQDYGVSTYPETSNTKAYLNYYAGDPGLGLNENWNVSFGSYPLNVIQGFVS